MLKQWQHNKSKHKQKVNNETIVTVELPSCAIGEKG